MSRLLELLNDLKTQAGPHWLTDSQQRVFKKIRRELHFPEKVNLHGPAGCGKTFLAWVVSRSLDIPYFPSPRAFDDCGNRPLPRAVVDNVSRGERATRDLLSISQRKGSHTLLFVTREPNVLRVPTVMLPSPSPQDFDVVYRNLSLLEFYALPPVREGTLWNAIHAVL
jgi:hypothetical protein